MSEYRRILYLDADIIQCRAGAQRLLDLEMDGKPIAAARDGNYWGVLDIRRTQKRYLRRVGQSKENYVNAGVLLIDTQKYVKFLDENNILNELVSCAGILKVHDQSYLNMKFKDQIQLISPSWNFPMADEFVGSLHIADPVFLHFVGKTKPWLSTDHPVRREYFETFTRFLEEYFQTSEFSAAPEPRHSEKASRKYNNPLREWIAWRMSKSRFDRAYHRAPDIVRSLVDRFRYQFEDEA